MHRAASVQGDHGVATAIAFGILQLRTNLGATLTEPDKFYWSQLPVDAGTQRRWCGIVRQGLGHMTGRTGHRLSPDAALSALNIHAVHSGLGFA
jgi:hypothetical protein